MKIEEILEQFPRIHQKIQFQSISEDPKLQSKNWFLQLFLDKVYVLQSKQSTKKQLSSCLFKSLPHLQGYFGKEIPDGGQDIESKHMGFLPEATFSALKDCTQERYDWSKVNPEQFFDLMKIATSQGSSKPAIQD